MLRATSDILFIKANLGTVARQIKKNGGLINYLHQYIDFKDIIAPHHTGPRPFYKQVINPSNKTRTSGALGNYIASLNAAYISKHPTHAFVGVGHRIVEVLSCHNYKKSCFYPLDELLKTYDFSMLLLGCVKESPGFPTVHVSQHKLDLSRKHLSRFLLRWDYLEGNNIKSIVAPEFPGCSLSFHKFYDYYNQENNLISGQFDGVDWLYVPSAQKALMTEIKILTRNPRFVDCGRLFCHTCKLRGY